MTNITEAERFAGEYAFNNRKEIAIAKEEALALYYASDKVYISPALGERLAPSQGNGVVRNKRDNGWMIRNKNGLLAFITDEGEVLVEGWESSEEMMEYLTYVELAYPDARELSEEEATELFYEYLESINGTGMNEPGDISRNEEDTGWEFSNSVGMLATVYDSGEVG